MVGFTCEFFERSDTALSIKKTGEVIRQVEPGIYLVEFTEQSKPPYYKLYPISAMLNWVFYDRREVD